MDGKVGEADIAFREASKLQLSNAVVLRDIGQGYLDKGKFDVAEAALRQSDAACRLPVVGLSGHATKPRPDAHTYLALGEALKQQNKLQEAISWNEKAKMFASSAQKALAIRAMQQLHGLTAALGHEVCAHARMRTHPRILAHARTHGRTYAHARAHAHTDTCTHMRASARARARTHELTQESQSQWAQMLQEEGQVPMPASELGIIRF